MPPCCSSRGSQAGCWSPCPASVTRWSGSPRCGRSSHSSRRPSRFLGATVVTWAAHATSSRYREAGSPPRLRPRGLRAAEARAREQARDWWKRILHDKGHRRAPARLPSDRHQPTGAGASPGPKMPGPWTRSEELGRGPPGRASRPSLTVSAQDDLHIPLTDRLYRTAVRHGLLPDVSEGWTLAGARGPYRRPWQRLSWPRQIRCSATSPATRETTTVAVRVTQSPTQVTVRVRDDGVGFTRRQWTPGAKVVGIASGTHGLASGSSAVQSALGKGTTVTLGGRRPTRPSATLENEAIATVGRKRGHPDRLDG